MAPFLQHLKFLLSSWLHLPFLPIETDGNPAPNTTNAGDNNLNPPDLPEHQDPYDSPTRRYSTMGNDDDGKPIPEINYELVLIEDVPTFSPTSPFTVSNIAFQGAESDENCPTFKCVEEECCGAGTTYDYGSGECLPDPDSIGFVTWSDQYQGGCVVRGCWEAKCCGFGESVDDSIQTVVYDPTLASCVLEMAGMCTDDEAELLELSGLNEDFEPIEEDAIQIRRNLQENATNTWIGYPKKLSWPSFEKDRDDNDTKDAYTATTQLVREYCDGVKKGNEAYIKELKIIAVFVPKKSEVKKSIRDAPDTAAAKSLLAHEQRHFAVSDYCARKMMAELKALSATGTSPTEAKNNLRKAFQAKLAELRKECDLLQQHGPGAEQDAWDVEVDELVKTNFRRQRRRMAWRAMHERRRRLLETQEEL